MLNIFRKKKMKIKYSELTEIVSNGRGQIFFPKFSVLSHCLISLWYYYFFITETSNGDIKQKQIVKH